MNQGISKQFNKKRKKGVAIEMAIATMLIVIAFCLIMLTVTKLSFGNSSSMADDVLDSAEASRIAEDFKNALEAESEGVEERCEGDGLDDFYNEKAKLENGLQSFISDGYENLSVKIWLVAPTSWSTFDAEGNNATHSELKFEVDTSSETKEETYNVTDENGAPVLDGDGSPTQATREVSASNVAEPCFFILKGYDKDSGSCKLSVKVKAEEQSDKAVFTVISYSTGDESYYFEGVKYKLNEWSEESTLTYNDPLLISDNGLSIYGYKNQKGYWDGSTEIVKNNHDMVVWAENAYSGSWAYMQGLSGQIVTEEQYKSVLSKTGSIYRDNLDYIGSRGADCYGLIRGYICLDEKTLTIDSELETGVKGDYPSIRWEYLTATYDFSVPDADQETMVHYATDDGTLATENTAYDYDWSSIKSGTALYRIWTEDGTLHGHSAIYIGNGLIIQAADYGVGINLSVAPKAYDTNDVTTLWTGWFNLYE